MFETELELEKKQSSFGPLVMIAVLLVSIVGGLGWFIYQHKRGLPQEEAAATLTAILAEKGPATLRFHTGAVVPMVDDQPGDPHYRLLEKAGLITIGKATGRKTPISLTAAGEKQITSFPEYKKRNDGDNEVLHMVPLATRKLVAINNVEMINATTARVEYTWKWMPNSMGDLFDASGPMVKGFDTWQRATLIQKHGADFYHADPFKTTVVFVKGDHGWKLAQ